MLWALYGLLHSGLRAAQVETARMAQGDRWRSAFALAAGGLVLLALTIPWMHWPTDPHFYHAAIGVGFIFALGTIIHLSLSDERTGRVSAIYMPFEAISSSLIWLLLSPGMLDIYRGSPGMSAAVIVAFALTTGGLIRIRPSDFTFRNFMLMAPLGLSYAIAGNVTKTVLPDDVLLPTALGYALIIFAVMTLMYGGMVVAKGKAKRDPASGAMPRREGFRKMLAGWALGLFAAAGYVAFAASVTLAPNPGYTSMLAMLLPVWLLIWHGIRRADDHARALPALCIVIGCALLIVAAW